jgi:hypothetical protein
MGKEKSQRKLKNMFQLNDNKNTLQNIRDATKVVVRGKCTALKEEKEKGLKNQ